MLTLALLLACADPPPAAVDAPVPLPTVPPAAVARLTDRQWRQSVVDLLDVAFDGYLPADYVLHGHASVGATTLAMSPLAWEQYEAAAWSVAEHALPDAAAREARLGCAVDDVPAADALACLRGWGAGLAARAWRRPVEVEELDALGAVAADVLSAGGPALAAQAVAALTLTSPHFLYRVETGEPDPDLPGAWRYTAHELAARLAYTLTDRPPDAALRALADADALRDPAVVRSEAVRLLATPDARDTFARFWADSLELHRLDGATKLAFLYPFFTPALRRAMVDEVSWLLLDATLDRDADFREVFTTRRALVDGPLAELYGVPAPPDGPGVVELPAERGGLLGRAAIAAIYSHPFATSPTRRGKFVRARLLCQSVPPPPPGVVASLEEVDGTGSLRDRLERHADDPACSACHVRIDPPGYGMENLDAVGRWREYDGPYKVDASGSLDGAGFDGVAELGEVVAAHADLPGCLALDLWRYASAQPETDDQLPTIEAMGQDFAADGYRWRELLLAVVTSDAFLRPAPGPLAAPAEACNGRDDDGDGATDEVVQACPGGLQACEAGGWGTCAPIVVGDTGGAP